MKHKLDLDLVLPSDAAECDACARRLVDALLRRAGVEGAHVNTSAPEHPKLCIHYDPRLLRLEDLEKLARTAGASVEARYEHLSAPAGGLRRERQARLAEDFLARQPGVLHASVSFGSRRLSLEFDPAATTRDALLAAASEAGIGASTEPSPPKETQQGEHDHEHGGLFGDRTELVFSLACGAFTGAGWATEKGGTTSLATFCFVTAYVLGGWYPAKEVALALRARKFEIDFLMLLAAVGAATLGEWFEGALLLFLFTLGHALEGYAMERARNAIAALAKLVPDTALRLDEQQREQEVPVQSLVAGDRVRVKPNTRVPADGFVCLGTSSVDQSPITGESVPADKRPAPDINAALASPDTVGPEHRVFAGTINGDAALTIVVTKAASDSTLARVVNLVAAAESQRSATQQFTDRFERIFVPLVVVVAVGLLFAWTVVDEPFSSSFYRAMAILVAASPCALAIATPSAVLSGVARAARAGVLVKGGAHLESLGSVRAVAFDKTGTLTENKPKLTDIVPRAPGTEDELLAAAYAIELQSDHPLAKAIIEGVRHRRPDLTSLQAEKVEAVVGYGVRGLVDGKDVSVGKAGLFTDGGGLPVDVANAVEQLQLNGRTVMVVRVDTRFLGVLGVMDAPRASASRVVAQLHALGVEQTLMLSGDNQRVADAVAKQIGIRVARGDLLPEQKVAAIKDLVRANSQVAMVGDGVNDAPAMANATVGIAMGAGGSDVALETADVALMADDLDALPFAVGLSRAARRIILQNLWASLGMVAFLVPATVFGYAKIGVAVALHEGSTLLVVANALRLLAYKDARTSQTTKPTLLRATRAE